MTNAINNPFPEAANFKEFKSFVGKYGFSLTNFYDTFILPQKGANNLIGNFNTIFGKIIKNNSQLNSLLRLYAEECTIPGFQISTGEYRITNTPSMKYAYGIVNNDVTFSFISDADSEIRKLFDIWQTYIYTHVTQPNITLTDLITNSQIDLGRTRYRDEYCTDIVVIKYERFASSSKNFQQTKFHTKKQIIPDSNVTSPSGFGKAIPQYSVRLMNAFPTNVSSIALSSGSSQLVKVQVTFEYETAISSVVSGNSIFGNFLTITE